MRVCADRGVGGGEGWGERWAMQHQRRSSDSLRRFSPLRRRSSVLCRRTCEAQQSSEERRAAESEQAERGVPVPSLSSGERGPASRLYRMGPPCPCNTTPHPAATPIPSHNLPSDGSSLESCGTR